MIKPETIELIVFFAQIIGVYFILGSSIYNLAQSENNRDLWISLLSSSLGYLLPTPGIKNVYNDS